MIDPATLRRVAAFGLVGGVGFVVDGGILWLLVSAGGDPYLVRAVSFPVAVLATWWLNRIWTFCEADRAAPMGQLGRYLAVQVTGAGVNLAVYATVLALAGASPGPAMAGFALGSFLGMFVNYFGARLFTFHLSAGTRVGPGPPPDRESTP